MTESTANPNAAGSDQPDQGEDPQRVVVLTPEGMGVANGGEDDERNPADLIEQPAKVMRVGSMVKQLLEEVRSAPLDEAGRARLAEIYHRSIVELKDGLGPELVDELDRLALPFSDAAPSDAELRVAQAQLVGWLEGLFHGIQAALMAQQMAAQAQLQQMRRGLPPGHEGHPQQGAPHPGMPQPGPNLPPGAGPGPVEGTGQYL